MKLVVFSSKRCWPSQESESGYATDGGFPFQMRALSELFQSTRVVVPCAEGGSRVGESPLTGTNLSIVPLTVPRGSDLRRKLGFPFWLMRNAPVLIREFYRADAIHSPIPGDVGTIGMLLAFLFRKPLFVRHCGNWFVQRTTAEYFWKWFMEKFAGGRKVMLATGGGFEPPSSRNRAIRWIFATTLTEHELEIYQTGRGELAKQSVRLIIACRQEREKGTGIVIESLPLIIKDFPGATLDVVGDGRDLVEFKQKAEELGLGDRINFHGKVDHTRLMNLLRRADLFCYPTRASEGFPKVVHEALACGLPVVTTRVSVLPQVIGNGCGVLIEKAAPAEVAEAVHYCLEDANRYRAMSDEALETAQQYSLEQWRDTIGDMLRTAWGTTS
jgi:glycosyltransferase involved in cell wall biosynthesis